MIRDLGGGMYMLSGSAGEVKFSVVGDKKTPKASCGVMVGKNRDTTFDWRNIVAWRALAYELSKAQKGSAVLAIARKEAPREYNGRTYQDYTCEFVAVSGAWERQEQAPAPGGFEGLEDVSDDELPF